MGWELTVECDATAMGWLVRNAPQMSPRVVAVGEACRLEWDGFESFGAELHNEVQAAAQQHLASLSGLASVLLSRYVFVSLVDSILVTTTIDAELTVVGPDGEPKPVQSFDPIPKLQSLTHSDDTVAKVLRLASGDLHDWAALYRLYEVLVDAADGTDALVALSGVSKASLSLFTRSANSPQLTGDASRHGVQRGTAPARAMPLSEAVRMLRELSLAWLLARASS